MVAGEASSLPSPTIAKGEVLKMAEDMGDVHYEKFQTIDQSFFRQRLNNSRSNGEFSDICLRVENSAKIFTAHRVVLAATSGILSLDYNFALKEVSELDLEDILTYIYVGSVQVPQDRIKSFLNAAKALMVFDLQDVEYDSEERSSIYIKEEPVFNIENIISIHHFDDVLEERAHEHAEEDTEELELHSNEGKRQTDDATRENNPNYLEDEDRLVGGDENINKEATPQQVFNTDPDEATCSSQQNKKLIGEPQGDTGEQQSVDVTAIENGSSKVTTSRNIGGHGRFPLVDPSTVKDVYTFTCQWCNTKFDTELKFDTHLMYTHLKEKLEDRFKIHDITHNFQTVTCPKCRLSFKTCLRFFNHLKTHGYVEEMINEGIQAQPKEDAITSPLRETGEDYSNDSREESNQTIEVSAKVHKRIQIHEDEVQKSDLIMDDKPNPADHNSEKFGPGCVMKQKERKEKNKKRVQAVLMSMQRRNTASVMGSTPDCKKRDGKQLTCSICEKKMSTKHALRTHELIHTGEKPFSCSFCGKRFNQSGSVKIHERLHTGEKPFSCSFCDQKFNAKGKLTLHKRKHTGEKTFSCSFCEKRFSRSEGAKIHERMHTVERPFACSFCEKRFRKSRDWKVHERLHTGERPYICSICTKAFASTSHRNHHMKRHMKEKNQRISLEKSRRDPKLQPQVLLKPMPLNVIQQIADGAIQLSASFLDK